ncbi:DUF5946 family protein [Shivajiella indica]|uniref:DUF5946 family protein n=1 Tax=Shivajiella indica TaxID=872115 RepID=A0ABW5B5Z8_9BACT
MEEYIKCFGCGSNSLNIEGETHDYLLSSPGCWIMFCEVMDREYSDFTYAKAHHFTVDAYTSQHVGIKDDKRAINSINIHLASLYMIFERDLHVADAASFKMNFSQYFKGSELLKWLEPPATFGELTIYELWDNNKPELHYNLAEKWAKSVWESWKHQHDHIGKLVNDFLNNQ